MISSNSSSAGWEKWLAANETGLVAFFAFFLFAVNLATCTAYPTSWMDEIMFSDPAIHYVNGQGLTSTAWWGDREATWSGNVPLYTLALIPWFKLLGVSLVKLHAFNYLVSAITAF